MNEGVVHICQQRHLSPDVLGLQMLSLPQQTRLTLNTRRSKHLWLPRARIKGDLLLQ